jgi:hypothetical protein
MIKISILVSKNGQALTNIPVVQVQAAAKKANVQRALEAAYDATNPHQIGFSIKYFGNALGYLVTEIDGISSQANLYWILYVNGTISNLGIDSEILKDGDKVEFRYEQYSAATHGKTIYKVKHEVYLKKK